MGRIQFWVPAVPSIDAQEFIAAVKPRLEAQDLEGLTRLLERRWNCDQLCQLLDGPCYDARKVAALSLALVGGKCCIPLLAQRLRDPDPTINEMAEHALWAIWFRSGSPQANHELARGAQAIHRMEYEHALEHLNRAVELSPDCAEAYNQRGIAYYLMEQYEPSVTDCLRAADLMPCHFGAWSGLGHCYAHQGKIAKAIEAYEKALEINPHLDCIRQSIAELKRASRA